MSSEHNEGGRPSLYSPELVARIAERVGRGCPIGRAAEAEGISARTIRRWKAERPDVLTTLKTAEAKTACTVWESIYSAAQNGDARTATWMVEKRWSDEPELDDEAIQDRASRMYQLGQQMRGTVPGQGAA